MLWEREEMTFASARWNRAIQQLVSSWLGWAAIVTLLQIFQIEKSTLKCPNCRMSSFSLSALLSL
ncbi:hypothetical protein OUZ56_016315 [Daphnia magna]|uniref:Uncharacterized protein n=1 Tax=Daphnia magna TaxID=35525 RepID=A0ABR0AQD9_9CRUS|nr:hypothetical protein OUZ56_016315 [Daphnia magna]